MQESVEARITEVHQTFWGLFSKVRVHPEDPVDGYNKSRTAAEEALEKALQNRSGWSSVAPGHFTYTNGLNVFIEPATPPNPWILIIETAKRVLRIELEEIVTGTQKNKTKEIQKAVNRLINDHDWYAVGFIRRRVG